VPHPRYLFDIGDLPPHASASLACSGLTSYAALKKTGDVPAREPIVIIGAGGLGLMSLELVKAMGGVGAILVDIDPVKRAAAERAGARAVIDGNAPDAAAQIRKTTDGGARAVIDHVGSSSTVQLGLDCLVKGGKLVIVGQFGGSVTVPTLLFPQRAIAIEGSYVGSLTEMAELLDFVRRTGLPRIPIEVRPLAEVNAALNDLRAGKVVGRLVLVPAADE
jgi:alcohol dehydrogenase, propanol-preferring